MNSGIGIKGHLRIIETPSARLLDPGELNAHLQLGRARVAYECENIITDVGLQAVCALLAGCAGVPSVHKAHIVPSAIATVTVNSMRLTGVGNPAQAFASDSHMAGAYSVQNWLTAAPSACGTYAVDSSLPVWDGSFPDSNDDKLWLAPEGVALASGAIIDAAFIQYDATSQNCYLTITLKSTLGAPITVWTGTKSGPNTTGELRGEYSRTGGCATLPASLTIIGPPIITCRGGKFNVDYPNPNQVRFSGFLNVVDFDNVLITEEGLFTTSRDMVARALIGRRAVGTITFANGNLPVDNDHYAEAVVISDGGATVTFEFNNVNSGYAPQNVPVTIEATPLATLYNLVNAINASGLNVYAEISQLNPPVATITNIQVGSSGNVIIIGGTNQITPPPYVPPSPLVITGMSGGYLGYQKTSAFPIQIDHTLTFARLGNSSRYRTIYPIIISGGIAPKANLGGSFM